MKGKKEKHELSPSALDLFCGCGGLTQGLKKAGYSVLGAVDIEPLALATFKANHPEVELWGQDIRRLKVETVKRKLKLRIGELDLLAGCPPCQGFSAMRTLNGARSIEDPRNDLLFEFLRFVEGLRPKAIMMENVPGLAKDERFRAFLARLEDLGYQGDFKILDASDFRVPQRRRRLIYLAGFGRPIDFAKENPRKKTVEDAIGRLPKAGESGDPVHDIPEQRTQKVLELIRKIPKDGGSRTDLPPEEQLECHKRCDGFKDVYGRMAWKAQAPTITSGCFNPSKGRFLHPEEDRAITMREAALLQGFPRWYKFPPVNSKTGIALMVGNALPPPFITAHARMIKKALFRQR